MCAMVGDTTGVCLAVLYVFVTSIEVGGGEYMNWIEGNHVQLFTVQYDWW